MALHHVPFQNGVQNLVRRQGILVLLIRPQLGRRRLGDSRLGNDLPVTIDPASQLEHFRFRHITDHRQPAAHVAVQRAVPDRQLALVAGGKHERTEFVGGRHQNQSTQTRLHIFLGHILRPIAKDRLETRLHHFKARVNADHVVLNAEIRRERLGVIETALRGIRRGHGDAAHILRAKRPDSERRRDCRINAAT